MKRFVKTALLSALLALSPLVALAATVQMTWTYEPADQRPIQGFKIYYGSATQATVKAPQGDAKPYDKVIVVADPAARRHTFNLDTNARQYFRMTAYGVDENGAAVESAFSPDEFNFRLKPGAPKDIKVIR